VPESPTTGSSGEARKKSDARSTKANAAAARAEAMRAEKARQRRTSILIGLGLFVLIGLIVGAVVYTNGQAPAPAASITLPAPDPAAALPKSALPSTDAVAYGVPYGTPSATISTVQVWEDFQCPFCGHFESTQAPGLQKLAADGKIFLVYRPTVFLDSGLPQANQSSARATRAWGCAIDGGVGERFHNTVFANQPAKEGTGYTDTQLLAFGKDAGLGGAAYDTFTSCVTSNTYLGWVSNSQQAFKDNAIPGTPTVVLDGKEVPSSISNGGGAALLDYLEANRKK
jgi:protein-disulfide isomerase